MVNLWSALAARDTRLLRAQVDALMAIGEHAYFVNYLRCHDDIGWGLDEDEERRLFIDPQMHKEYLYHFYEGEFPMSWSLGQLYNYDPNTGDARSCGTCASLCGVERAIRDKDPMAYDIAIRRVLLMHGAMSFVAGFPMLNCGDEIGQLNGWEYAEDADIADDSRYLHRSKFDWEKAALRDEVGTLQERVFSGLAKIRDERSGACFAPEAKVETLDVVNQAVFAVRRSAGEERVIGLFNFSEHRQEAWLNGQSFWLEPYEMKRV